MKNWSYFQFLPVVSGIIFSALAQVCMKQATNIHVKTGGWYCLLFSSFLCYGCSFLSYYFALKAYPISKIGPVMTVGVVALVVLSGAVMGEVLTVRHVVGIFLSVLSILLIMY